MEIKGFEVRAKINSEIRFVIDVTDPKFSTAGIASIADYIDDQVKKYIQSASWINLSRDIDWQIIPVK